MTNKRFYRKSSDKKIGGVCSGLADYFDIDPTIIRIIFAVLAIGYGIGILLYLLVWIIAPEQ
ncbi:MAG: PspC domain-containing protein [Bacteroidales bacterium]